MSNWFVACASFVMALLCAFGAMIETTWLWIAYFVGFSIWIGLALAALREA